jgi:hypothetical protein
LARLARLRFSKNVGATFLCQRIFVIREAVRLSPSYEENGPKTTEIHFVCVVAQIPCVLQMTVDAAADFLSVPLTGMVRSFVSISLGH